MLDGCGCRKVVPRSRSHLAAIAQFYGGYAKHGCANDRDTRDRRPTHPLGPRRYAIGLFQAAGAGGATARLFRRVTPRINRLNAPGMDERERPGYPHHWAVRSRRHSLHGEVFVGTIHRRARCAGVVLIVGSAAGLASAIAAYSDGRHHIAGAMRPRPIAVAHRRGRTPGFYRIRHTGHCHRRFSRREPTRGRTSGGHGFLRGGISRRCARLHRRAHSFWWPGFWFSACPSTLLGPHAISRWPCSF